MNAGEITCTRCTVTVDPLAIFPDGAGGIWCLDCYAADQEDQPLPTAAEIRAMWGMGR